MITTLSFFKSGIMSSGVLPTIAQRLFPSNAFDIDPIFASSAMPGFTEWAGMYRSFRTLKASIAIEFCNMMNAPVSIFLVPVNYDPGASVTLSVATTLSSQPNSKVTILSPAGGQDRATLRSKARVNQFAGAMSNAVDAFTGATNGSVSPVQFWGFSYGAIAQGTSIINPGVGVTIKLLVELEFFELTTPST